MIKAIVFDAYGTLISTGNGSINATNEILKLNQRDDINAVEFYSVWKKYHREHIDRLSFFIDEADIFQEDLVRLYETYKIKGNAKEDVKIMLNTLGNRKVFPETNFVIDSLKNYFVLCIGSTSDTAPLMKDIKKNQINIKQIYTSESIKAYKPNIKFYKTILNDLNVESKNVLFVGDSLIDDIYGPQKMGMKTCWINRKDSKSNDIIPDYTITNLKELLNIPDISNCLYK